MKLLRSLCLIVMAVVVVCQADFTADECFKLFIHSPTNQSEDLGGPVCDTVLKEYREDFFKNLLRSFDNGESAENVDCMIAYLKKIDHDKVVLGASHLENSKNVSDHKLKTWQAYKAALSKVSFIEVLKFVISNHTGVQMIEDLCVLVLSKINNQREDFSIYSNVKPLR